MSIKILLAEDHAIVREGLRSLIGKQSDMEIIGEAEDGQGSVELARQLQPDIIVMDVILPILNGMDATRQIKAENPDVKILALSVHDDSEFVLDMVKAGVSGYMIKDCILEDLVKAIKTITAGESFLSPKAASAVLVDKTLEQFSAGEPSNEFLLRDHEVEVLKLLAKGKTAKEIAHVLDMSVKTIEGNLRQIMNKLEIDNLAGLIKYAINNGWATCEV
ncbi:MAG: response regulator transcription factor [Planctomycetes bacterium]|nr:response regulator transcription factor [Planctomycetota bacterium]